MTEAFDAIIVGSGAGGAGGAYRLAEARLGGTNGATRSRTRPFSSHSANGANISSQRGTRPVPRGLSCSGSRLRSTTN